MATTRAAETRNRRRFLFCFVVCVFILFIYYYYFFFWGGALINRHKRNQSKPFVSKSNQHTSRCGRSNAFPNQKIEGATSLYRDINIIIILQNLISRLDGPVWLLQWMFIQSYRIILFCITEWMYIYHTSNLVKRLFVFTLFWFWSCTLPTATWFVMI